MRPQEIVFVEELPQACAQIGERGVLVQVDVLVLDGAPEAFDEGIVQRTAATIHTDSDIALFQRRQEQLTGELRALIGVEDFRLRIRGESGIENLSAQPRIDCVRHGPAQDEAAEPVDDRSQVGEAILQPNIRNIAAPNVVDGVDRDIAQQIRMDLVAGRRLTQVSLGIDRRQPENTHQALNAFPVYTEGNLAPQHRQQAATAVERPARVMLVEQAKQQQVLFALEDRRVIVARSR